MNDLKIGNLVFTKKAVGLIAFCLFLNGSIIGAMVAYKASHPAGINVIVLYAGMFLPYLVLGKSIRKNIIELN